MRKYKQAMQVDPKKVQYAKLIDEKKEDGTFYKIKRAEQLRGKILTQPTDPKKKIELSCYKSLEPILFLEPHKKLNERIENIRTIRETIANENRSPTDVEIQQIAKYNATMLKQANRVMHEVLAENPQIRKVTSIEQGRIQLEYIRMNEQPDEFVLHNRYYERVPELMEDYTSSDKDVISHQWSPLKYRKRNIGSKKDLQEAGILPKPGDQVSNMRDRLSRRASKSLDSSPSNSTKEVMAGLQSFSSSPHKLSRRNSDIGMSANKQSYFSPAKGSQSPKPVQSQIRFQPMSPKVQKQSKLLKTQGSEKKELTKSPFSQKKMNKDSGQIAQKNSSKKLRISIKSSDSNSKSILKQVASQQSLKKKQSLNQDLSGNNITHSVPVSATFSRKQYESQALLAGDESKVTLINNPKGKVVFDSKIKVLPSEFAESSFANLPSSLPMIQGQGKFSYCQPIVPQGRPGGNDDQFFGLMRQGSVQFQADDISPKNRIIDVKFPNLTKPKKRGSNSQILVDQASSNNLYNKKSHQSRSIFAKRHKSMHVGSSTISQDPTPNLRQQSTLIRLQQKQPQHQTPRQSSTLTVNHNSQILKQKSPHAQKSGISRNNHQHDTNTLRRRSSLGDQPQKGASTAGRNNSSHIMFRNGRLDSQATIRTMEQGAGSSTVMRQTGHRGVVKAQTGRNASNFGSTLRIRTQAEEQAILCEAGAMARNASMMRLWKQAEEKQKRLESRKVVQTLMPDLQSLEQSKDPDWHYLMRTIEDKSHFYQAAFNKLQKDATNELAYQDTRKSPVFNRPIDAVNETSLFRVKKLDAFDHMKAKLEKSELPTELDLLLDNQLGKYLNELIERDPLKGVVKRSKESEARWAENDPKQRQRNKTLDYVDEQQGIQKILFR